MRIPIVGVPEPDGPQRSFTPVNPAVYDKVGQAGERFGGALEGIGSLGAEIKSAYDDASITKVSTAAQAGATDAISSLTSAVDPKTGKPNPANNDPSTYAKRWEDAKQRLLAAAQKDPMAKTLSPAAQLRLQTTLQDVFARGDVQVRETTRQKMLSVAGAINEVALNGMIQAGREDDAQALRAKLVSSGERTPEWGAQKQIEIPQRVDQAGAMKLMNAPVEAGGGPFVAEKVLQQQDPNGGYAYFKRLLPEQRQELLRQAAYDGRILRDQTSQKYAGYIANKTPIDPMEVKADVAYQLLNESLAKTLLKPPAPAEDTPQGYASLMNRIADFDPARRDYQEQFLIGQSIANFTGVNRSDAEQLFHEKLNPHSPTSTQAVRSVLDASKSLFEAGAYGQYNITVQPTRADLERDPDAKPTKFLADVQVKAQMARAAVDQKVMDYVRAHPGSENDEETLMRVFATASAAQRGTAGAQLFNPPQLTPAK